MELTYSWQKLVIRYNLAGKSPHARIYCMCRYSSRQQTWVTWHQEQWALSCNLYMFFIFFLGNLAPLSSFLRAWCLFYFKRDFEGCLLRRLWEFNRGVKRVMFVSMDVVKPTPLDRGLAGDMLYVALGEQVKKNKLLLLWALQNSGGRKICIVLVHRPAKVVPISSELATCPRAYLWFEVLNFHLCSTFDFITWDFAIGLGVLDSLFCWLQLWQSKQRKLMTVASWW